MHKMPDWSYALTDPEVNRRSYPSIGWVLTNGSTFSTTMSYLGGDSTPDAGALSSVRETFGGLSNAGIVRMSEKRDTYIATKNAIVYDEAYNDGMVLVIVLENNNGVTVSAEIPNPDLSLFESDGVTLKAPLAVVDGGDAVTEDIKSATDAFASLVNGSFTPANTFAFVRGYAVSRKIKVQSAAQTRPSIVEPGLNPPGDEPAV